MLAAEIRGFVPDEVVDEVLAPRPAGTDLRALAIAAAQRHGLAPELVLAVVGVESAFKPDAVSHKGAQGLMQLMPGTAKELGWTTRWTRPRTSTAARGTCACCSPSTGATSAGRWPRTTPVRGR